MSLKKVTLASLILLSLTACSGGGGSSAPVAKNDKKPTVQQPAKPANKVQDNAKQAEADRIAKQKAEEERLKKEEADRLAKQKAEEENLKKEIERLNQENNKLKLTEKIYAKFDDVGLNKDEAQQFIKHYVDSIKSEDEFIVTFRKYRMNKIQELANELELGDVSPLAEKYAELEQYSINDQLEYSRARKLGASERLAREFIGEKPPAGKIFWTKKEMDKALINFAKGITDDQYPQGLTIDGQQLVYNQPFSMITVENKGNLYEGVVAKGLETNPDYVPTQGKAVYTGKAYSKYGIYTEGDLTYTVDFANKMGKGKIVSPRFNYDVILGEGFIQGNQITSSTGHARYDMKFFGSKAEEIGGSVNFGDYLYGVAGTRGEITK